MLRAQGDAEARRSALNELLTLYWPALYAFARRRGLSVEAAEDCVQGFAQHLLARDFAKELAPERGRLRGYLAQALRHYLADEHDKATAQKRGGTLRPVALDDVEASLTDSEDPERALLRTWAREVMRRALAKLSAELPPERLSLIDAFFGAAEPPSYRDAALANGISVPELKSFLHRARRRYAAVVRELVADTVASPEDVDAEVATLLAVLS